MPIDVSCFHLYSIVPLHRQSERLIRQTINPGSGNPDDKPASNRKPRTMKNTQPRINNQSFKNTQIIMAVMYKLYQDKRVTSSTKGKWYARAIHPQVIETDALAERIQRNCTVKRSDVLAVLAELVEVMQDELQQSRVVKLNGFGSFKIGLRTKPADKAADFNVTSNVVNYRVNFLPEMTGGGGKGKKRNRKFLDGLKVQEAPKNPVDTKKPAEGKAEENVDPNPKP